MVNCLGELLIDFICQDIGSSLADGKQFVKKAGGAPANVAAAIAKLGGKARFIGAVGKDPFGDFLDRTLSDVGVDTSLLYRTAQAGTTLAFVSLQDDGERDFVFARGADELLSVDLVDWDQVSQGGILHLGGATGLLGGQLSETYRRAWGLAGQQGQLLSFDPNFRVDLWKGRVPEFIQKAKGMLSVAHLLKVSLEEMELLTDIDRHEIEKGVLSLHELGAHTIVVTLGKDGTLLSNGKEAAVIPSIPVHSIDSTGAGDAFIGALLYQLDQEDSPIDACKDLAKMSEAVAFANRVGALTCTQMGAIEAIPTLEEVYSEKG